ncbi:MAG TPA: hypothetical protein VKZ53_18435 [Candidatus Angelobacter sp.]|nr:hypothetical protein [Candidatus Angelobacter sp.]
MKYGTLLFFLALVLGIEGQTTSNIRGIKIASSGFDQQTHTAKLVFVNDTPIDITAFRYRLKAINNSPEEPSHNVGVDVDMLLPQLYWDIDKRRETWIPRATNHVIRPGESWEIKLPLPDAVVDATIAIDMVAYSDGTAEAVNEQALQYLQEQRTWNANIYQTVTDLGRQVLKNASDEHPFITLVQRLEEAQKQYRKQAQEGDDRTPFQPEINELADPKPGTRIYSIIAHSKSQSGKSSTGEASKQKTEADTLQDYIAEYEEMASKEAQQSHLKLMIR